MNALCNKGILNRLTLACLLTCGLSVNYTTEPSSINAPISSVLELEFFNSAKAQSTKSETASSAPTAVNATVSTSVGAALKQASDNMGAQKFGPAAAGLKAALGTSGLTEFEVFSIHRLLIGAELGNQQFAQLIESGRLVMASPFLNESEKLYVRQSMITASFKLSKFAEAAQLAESGLKSNPQDLSLLDIRLKSLYLAKNFAAATQAAEDYLKASGNNKPSEDLLKIYAHSASEIDSSNHYLSALTLLVQNYPNADYWSDLLYRKNASGAFQRVGEIQFYRLLQATKSFKDPGELIDAAELAIKAGFPLEANGYLDAGVQLGLLPTKELQGVYNDKRKQIAGLIQQDAAALESKAASKASSKSPPAKTVKPKSTSALMAEGYNSVLQGQVDHGLESLQNALSQSQGKPDAAQARLSYALALHKAGKTEEAIREFKMLKSDAPEVSNLWLTVFNVK